MTDEFFGEPIHVYTRREALEDGALVDCTELAREAGIKYPVAMTRAAWALCVALSPAAKRAGNDEKGRLWDVVWMLSLAMRRARGPEVAFQVMCLTTSTRPSEVSLKGGCGPGDLAEPVITIMLPEED